MIHKFLKKILDTHPSTSLLFAFSLSWYKISTSIVKKINSKVDFNVFTSQVRIITVAKSCNVT